jgi:hypothetical protein
MLPAETFETRKRLLTFSQAKPRQNIEAIWKTYGWWVCGRSLAGIAGSNPAEGMDVCLS